MINADIRTMDVRNPRAEAVAILEGKFIAVGSSKLVRTFATSETRVIDAGGRTVLPGFNDAHVHFAAIGNKFSTIDLRSAKTPAEAAAMFGNYARVLPKGRWILGSGLNPENLPDRKTVDPLTPDNPVFVYSSDGRSAFANGLALSKARIGQINRDSTGLISGAEMRSVSVVVPTDHTRNWPKILETASNYAASLGVTSVQDMHSDELADVYRQLEREGTLKTRIYDCSPISAWRRLAAEGVKAASGDAMVRTGCVKTFSDGDETEAAELQRDIAAADKAGLQVMVHAIGARPNSLVLDGFENAIKLNGRRDRRFRVEHAQNASSKDLPRFARAKVIASMQPWLFNGTNPSIYKTHLQLGTYLAFGSDASIADLNPLSGLQAATTGPGAISLENAVFAYTAGSAYAEFQENVKGTIAVGKVADLVILSDDIFAAGVLKVGAAKVIATMVAGRVVFGEENL